QLLAYDRKRIGWDRKVERVVAAGTAFDVQFLEALGQLLEGSLVVECALDEPDSLRQSLPHLLTKGRAGVVLDRFVHDAAEVLMCPVASCEPDEPERRRQQTAVGEVIGRRQQLLAREVAGYPENHNRARARDVRHPFVAFVAQWVSPPRFGRRGSHFGHFLAASSCSCVAPRSSCHDFSNFSTPSSSKTTNTSARSMPTASSLSNTSCASAAVPVTVSPVMTAWSATASIVFSGMVFTVFGAT